MKVFHLTYYSLSGCISHIILKNIYPDIRYMSCGYEKLDNKISEINLENERLVTTNFTLSLEQYERLLKIDSKMLFIDHHLNSEKLPKSDKVKVNRKFSSCYFLYKLFENKIIENKEKLNILAKLGNSYDMWDIGKPDFNNGYSLNELFWKYNFNDFVIRFKNGFDVLTIDEKKYVNKKVEEKKNRLSKLTRKEIKIKNSLLVMLNEKDYDLVNDVALGFPMYDIYLIYLQDKQKLTIKHKLDINLSEKLDFLFKHREDLEFGGDLQYGYLNYNKISDTIFDTDIQAILNSFDKEEKL